MIKQNVNIVNFNLLYEILDEIKENLSFNIVKYENINVLNKQEKSTTKNSLIITNTNIDNLSKKNLLFEFVIIKQSVGLFFSSLIKSSSLSYFKIFKDKFSLISSKILYNKL